MKHNRYLVFTAVGFELIGIIVVAILTGQELDKRYDLKGMGMVGLSMLGLAGWIYHVVMLAKTLEKNSGSDGE
jgi:F0F1-type ATP synthase assembly protein I